MYAEKINIPTITFKFENCQLDEVQVITMNTKQEQTELINHELTDNTFVCERVHGRISRTAELLSFEYNISPMASNFFFDFFVFSLDRGALKEC